MGSAYDQGNYLIVATGGMLLVLEAWIVVEGILAVRKHRATAEQPAV